MLSIGEFSKIAQVTTKTLRYYAKIGLLIPQHIQADTKYRYYTVDQLQTLCLIKRLKSYHFTLDEIKELLDRDFEQATLLPLALHKKEQELTQYIQEVQHTLCCLQQDIQTLAQGKSLLSYLEDIDIELVEVETMHLLYIRTIVFEDTIQDAYISCFQTLLQKAAAAQATLAAPPMVLFHDNEFTAKGFDMEFALPIQERITGTRDFHPGLCLKTVVQGSYTELSSVYAKQVEWAEKEGYQHHDALYEVYVTDPQQVQNEQELLTEVYLPIKKIR